MKTFWPWFYRLWVLSWVLTLSLSAYLSAFRPVAPDAIRDRVVPIKAMFHAVFVTPLEHAFWIAALLALAVSQVVFVVAGLAQRFDKRRRYG